MGGYNGDNIPAITATLGFFSDIKIDNEGNLLIADPNNHRVRKVDLSTGRCTKNWTTCAALHTTGRNIYYNSSKKNTSPQVFLL